jgi:imidazolonepropionase-like amidohydrolase
MRKTCAFIILLGFAGFLFVRARESKQTKSLALLKVTIIDITNGVARPDMTVLIDGEQITAVGPANKVRVPNGAEVIDAGGKFLIPGFWDMHTHWFGFDNKYLGLFIANGVTGIRVMWGTQLLFDLRKQTQQRTLLAPRMIIASTIVDGPNPIWPGSLTVSNEAEGRQAVRKMKEEGYDFIKVYSVLPREGYLAIADEAKKQGIPFAGHVPESVSVAEASDAGQKSIEHLTGFLAACSTREEELRKAREKAYSDLPKGQRLPANATMRTITQAMLDSFNPEKARRLFSRLKQNHTWQCPTLNVLRYVAFPKDPSFKNDPRLKYMPSQLRMSWDPSNDFRFKDKTAEDFALSRRVYDEQLKLVGMMHVAGVELLAGTDVLNPYCFPGFSLHDELGLMVQAGLSPIEALRTTTMNPARFLGLEQSMGTVEKGKIANLVLLDANPLLDIANTKKINAVVMNGRLLNRSALGKILSDVESLSRN